MTDADAPAPRVLGRTGHAVAAVWREQADGSITAGVSPDSPFTGLVVDASELDRRGGDRVRGRVATHGRPFDFLIARGLLANDLKVGWPLHRLQRLRDEKLFRYVVIETSDALEAEWISANAPVHGVVIAYDSTDMAARYRVFDAAANAGVALIGHATTTAAAALQLATPRLTATLLPATISVPAALPTEAADALWSTYSAAHPEPQKLRGAHPPDFGT
ncbi:MAG TPA: hypothetical protein VF595_13055 [Tepidisphaeraceae bacterium]|jgi:hypothetical protein